MNQSARSMARFWNSEEGRVCTDLSTVPYFMSEVEPAEGFDYPEYRDPLTPTNDLDTGMLSWCIGKSLSGVDVLTPAVEEWIGWFRGEGEWTKACLVSIPLTLCEIHRREGMRGLQRLEAVIGASIYDIAATMRRARVTAAYPCLWINAYAWNPPRGHRAMIGGEWIPVYGHRTYAAAQERHSPSAIAWENLADGKS